MLDQSHATVARPALLIVVAHYVLVVRVRILRQESLNQVTRVLLIKLDRLKNLFDNGLHIYSIKNYYYY